MIPRSIRSFSTFAGMSAIELNGMGSPEVMRRGIRLEMRFYENEVRSLGWVAPNGTKRVRAALTRPGESQSWAVLPLVGHTRGNP